MACVLTVFPFFYWHVLMVYVFGDYSGTVKCKISIFCSVQANTQANIKRIFVWLSLVLFIVFFSPAINRNHDLGY
jgi:hypothetical protein